MDRANSPVDSRVVRVVVREGEYPTFTSILQLILMLLDWLLGDRGEIGKYPKLTFQIQFSVVVRVDVREGKFPTLYISVD